MPLVLIIGSKGGVGTTSVARHLARQVRGLGLDLDDGSLAMQLDRQVWALYELAQMSRLRRDKALAQAVKKRITLLWTPECEALAGDVWPAVRALADRTTVVADGGLDPPPQAGQMADRVFIISNDDTVARWHAEKLAGRHPGATVVTVDLSQRGETKRVARELAE